MKIYGYIRVSTKDQCHALQREALETRYPQIIIFEDKASGTSMAGRENLETILKVIGKDEKLVVTKLDRLARSVGDLSQIVKELESKQASLEILDQQIDTSTAAGKAFLQMLGVFAEFETNLRAERQKVGIEAAKERGAYKGRKKIIPVKAVRDLKESGLTMTQITKKLGISKSSFYRALEESA